jgi:hypothetical protein
MLICLSHCLLLFLLLLLLTHLYLSILLHFLLVQDLDIYSCFVDVADELIFSFGHVAEVLF